MWARRQRYGVGSPGVSGGGGERARQLRSGVPRRALCAAATGAVAHPLGASWACEASPGVRYQLRRMSFLHVFSVGADRTV